MADGAVKRGTRWLVAAAIVGLVGWQASVQAVHRSSDIDVERAIGINSGATGALYEAPGGMALRLDASQRAALGKFIAEHPLDGTAVALAAFDAAARGDRRKAGALAEHALALQPRARLAWLWKVDSDIHARRMKEAAQGTLQLLAIDPPRYQAYNEILAVLVPFSAALPPIAEAMTKNPPWRQPFVSLLTGKKVDAAIIFQLTQGGPREAPTIIGERGGFIQDRVVNGDYDRAYLAWLSFLPDSALSGTGQPYDARFVGLPGAPPFNWRITASEGDRAEIDRGLEISYSGRRPVTLASQVVLLEPGAYRLRSVVASASTTGPTDSSSEALTWTATCLPSNRKIGSLLLNTQAAGRVQSSPAFRVDAEGCDAVSLDLGGSASEFPVRIDVKLASILIDRVADDSVVTTAPAATPTSAIPTPTAAPQP